MIEKRNDVYIYTPPKATTYYILFISDVHIDSVHCDRELLTKHLKEAEEKKALVFINGDLFDVMQGRYDPRGSKRDIKPEYLEGNYFDKVVEDAANFLLQFDVEYFISTGNHELSIQQRQEFSLLSALSAQMRMRGGKVEIAGYSGYLSCSFGVSTHSTALTSKLIHFHHGMGGNARRSKGVLQVDINQSMWPDADIITEGHIHQKWHVVTTVERVNGSGNINKKQVHSIQTSTYKKQGTWEEMKKFPHASLGGWFYEINISRPRKKGKRILQHNERIYEA